MPEASAIVTALLLERPMCLACVTDRTTHSVVHLAATLETIGRVLTLNREEARCRTCGTTAEVWWIERPREPTPPAERARG